MKTIKKKFIVDEHGVPKEVILSFKDFQEIERLLGLDLDAETINNLRKARHDREKKNKDAYVDLDSI
jgi:regulator of PEP synthase PpsR (kinase-PPPase family)